MLAQNNGHYASQGHQFWYQSKAPTRLPINEWQKITTTRLWLKCWYIRCTIQHVHWSQHIIRLFSQPAVENLLWFTHFLPFTHASSASLFHSRWKTSFLHYGVLPNCQTWTYFAQRFLSPVFITFYPINSCYKLTIIRCIQISAHRKVQNSHY